MLTFYVMDSILSVICLNDLLVHSVFFYCHSNFCLVIFTRLDYLFVVFFCYFYLSQSLDTLLQFSVLHTH